MARRTPPPLPREPRTGGAFALGTGAVLLMVICCAGPALLATGVAASVLAAIGAWVSNPWVIAVAVALPGTVTTVVIRRTLRRRAEGGDNCCPPRA